MPKIPQQNLEAEASLLGALLLDKENIIKISDTLRPNDFYKDSHGLIYQAILDLFEQHEPVDILSVGNRLSEKKQLEIVGGKSYLAELTASVPSSSHVISYANIIRKKSTLRNLERAAAEISEFSFSEDQDVEKLLDRAEQKLFAISQASIKKQFIPIKNILNDTFNRIDELHKSGGQATRGIPTGYNDLDKLLSGLQKSDLVVLAARPSLGKTSLALDLVRNIAIRSKTPVGIFSLEMSKEQLVDRLLASEAGVDLWKMRTGRLSDKEEDDDFPRIGRAMGILSEAPIFIDDSPNVNIMEIRTKARRLKMEHNLGLLVVDYLQLMDSGGRQENRVQEISEISRALKQIAKELDVPVLALSQLSRAVENRSPAIPKLADLRESGAIEQDADIVMFIYRKAKDKSRECSEDEKGLAEIHIDKHRNGPTGIVRLFFDENKVSFKNLETSYQSEKEIIEETTEMPIPTLDEKPPASKEATAEGWTSL
ncbi:MAG: replicative DNA helicase [Candidatus Komeilibacteria bacterium CG11_big_fil_rev_8_21_14_0_20_36_20]|uniref:Replicative DNA helicase n=1 Tax=Candidatus Komeilibacteria bacterium CG11_big_fil_rev_8_21_14_0_20_36_20 TaxID=1974477 RepID=A0A2H0NEA9_9BACT|nr:MAG: replicative DNA helicase [Candidatus Komeilibacteria bacterium CG11_big_fil_rev_8_21_14_0_20_36_20]PIR81688.1 MAG: replicative DNA helicase [Candidatus Komeilibacteria bacterium CG10_big_fil_rev_8_21_14_0_10_36_65]PJC55619.1 MAG: replicative DNA helicase [Candidatus Komeilibacteria bacterium CG_4_9_14_0_2_um_filter_36_13]